jgi:hypothetical protein
MNILAWRVTSSKEVVVPPLANAGNILLFNVSEERLKFVGPHSAFIGKRRKLLGMG